MSQLIDNKQKRKSQGLSPRNSLDMDSDGDSSSSPGSGSGVWEKSENSKWIVVAETKHRIPRKARVRTVASVDPSLGIREFITSFEPEEPPEGNNSILVGDGSSLVRLDRSAGENMEEVQPGPSSENSGASPEEAEREERPGDRSGRSRRRRQRRHRGQGVTTAGTRCGRGKRMACVSVESSPGRDSPSPESLSRIVKKYSTSLTGFS